MLSLVGEREKMPSKGTNGQKGSLMGEREKIDPERGKKLARKAERENITFDPERGRWMFIKQFDSEREKFVQAERRREK